MKTVPKEIIRNKSPPSSPKHITSSLICSTHNEKIVSFCLAKKCNFSALCSKCIVFHLNNCHNENYAEVDLQNYETLKLNYSKKLQKMIGEYDKLLKEITKYSEQRNVYKDMQSLEKNIGLFKENLMAILEEAHKNFIKQFSAFFTTQNTKINEKLITFKKTIQNKLDGYSNDLNDFLLNEEGFTKIKEASSISLDVELEKNIKICKKIIDESLYLSNYQQTENNPEIINKLSKELSETFSKKFPLKTANTGLINNSSVNFEKNASFLTKKSFLNFNLNGESNKTLMKSFELNGSIADLNREKNPLNFLKLPPSPIIMKNIKNGKFLDNSIQHFDQKEEIQEKLEKKKTFRSLSPVINSNKMNKIEKIEKTPSIEFNEKQLQEFLNIFDRNWKTHNIKILPLDLCRSITLIKTNGTLSENQKILKKFTNIYYESINHGNNWNIKNEPKPLNFCFLYKESSGDYCFFLFNGLIRKNLQIFFINFNNQEKIIEKHQNIMNALKSIVSLFLYEKMKNIIFDYEEIKYVIFDRSPSNDIKRLAICYTLLDFSKSKSRSGGVLNQSDLLQFQKNLKYF